MSHPNQKPSLANQELPPLPELQPGVYCHYKHPELHYRVLGVARHTETLKPMVVYQALYTDGKIWVRPYEMFVGTVMVEGKEVKRFRKVESGE